MGGELAVCWLVVQHTGCWQGFGGKWGNRLSVDGDLDQVLAAEPGFHGAAPSAAPVVLLGVIHGA